MKELRINYVDAPPGAGKTRACIEMMRQHIEAGVHGERVGYIFYVSPTVELLRQTIKGLQKRVPDLFHAGYIRAVYSGEMRTGRDRTEHQVYSILDGRETNSLKSVPFNNGSIMFLTHATFLKLKKNAKFKHVTVIFDESRKWIEKQKLRMDMPGVKDLFSALFDVRPMANYTGINELVAKEVAENAKSSLISTKASAAEFKRLDGLHTSLSSSEGPVRMKVYAVMSGKTMIQIMLPSHPFVGFKEVYILSAAFERSQMYHLFKSENCELQNRTRVFMNSYAKQGYGAALDTIGERQSHLVLLPLLGDNGVPSKYQLSSGIALPRKNITALTETKDELEISTDTMRDVVAHIRDPLLNAGKLRPNHTKLLAAFGELGVEHDILGWQIRMAEQFARKWFKKHGQPHKGLLFVNKADENVAHDRGLFKVLSIGKAEGNNGYMKSNLVSFLAAVNPEPEVARVLKALLPDYDPDEDYVIDKAIQCIGRGNIRNHNSKEKMLAIVSTRGMARSISKLMNDAPEIRSDLMEYIGDYVTWSAKISRSAKVGTSNATKEEQSRAEQRRYKANPLNRKLASLRVSRSKRKKKGDAEGVARLDAEIAQLTKERDEQRKWN